MTRSWHLVTGEFPPAPGGVSDYTRAVAARLAAAGDPVHVWCPRADGLAADPPGVEVHRSAGHWSPRDISRFDAELDVTPSSRRLLVQWVPHAFGRRSLNLAFCRWVGRRARRGDVVDLMVHEPFLPFREGSLRQDAAAAVHRVMVWQLLRAARKAWVSIPAWGDLLRPFAPRSLSFCWLPVPSNIPVVDAPGEVAAVRAGTGGPESVVVGHFGTYDRLQRAQLEALAPRLLETRPDLHLLLIGRGSASVVDDFHRGWPRHRSRVHATGALEPHEVSARLQACDVLVQPYPDGASTRRGTLMAALAHGTPVVTTVGRLSESIWRGSGAVTAVPAGDTNALATATLGLVADEARRRAQSMASAALYRMRFDVSHTIAALREDTCERI